MNDGGPAFPTPEWRGKNQITLGTYGMTLRDYFATKAMQGFLNNLQPGEGYEMSDIVEDSYMMADAMLAEREK